jgi:hypothetical protein
MHGRPRFGEGDDRAPADSSDTQALSAGEDGFQRHDEGQGDHSGKITTPGISEMNS